MKTLFIKPPRKIVAFNSELQNVTIPLAIPCLSAVLKKLGVNVKVLDCIPFKIGWTSLRRFLEKQSMDIVFLSEGVPVWGPESIRAAHLVKEVSPHTKVIAGGIYFSNMAKQILENTPIDYIVIGEGEFTLIELVKELQKPVAKQNFKKIQGLAYKEGKKIVVTPPRPLIHNLDLLPFPDYSVMPMDIYSKKKPAPNSFVTIEHSRGCHHDCKFCICWSQMGERKQVNGKVQITPRYRTKSVIRIVDEIEFLYTKYKCRELFFIDNSWGPYPEWNKHFAKQILERKLDVTWSANFRADDIVRNEKLGILKKLVKAGLTHVLIGAESCYDEDLKYYGKKTSGNITRRAFQILKENHPNVIRQATFVLDVRKETKDSLLRHLDYAIKLDTDLSAIRPVTPFPGTKLWDEVIQNDELATTDMRRYDWINPVVKMHYLSKEEFENFVVPSNKRLFRLGVSKGLLSTDRYRRKITAYALVVTSRYILSNLKGFIGLKTEIDKRDGYSHYIIPDWYEK